MSGRIIFMTEEPSMSATLRAVLPKVFPGLREHEHWLAIDHQGKTDLEASFPKKMRHWREPGVCFIILCDNDGSNCQQLKQRLAGLVPVSAPGHRIRIVCQELESWLLGDLKAVAAAYPKATRHTSYRSMGQRDPDVLTNASQLLKELTGTGAKISRAKSIAAQLNPPANRSKSFEVLLSGIASLIETL
jgi:hypothetical protein